MDNIRVASKKDMKSIFEVVSCLHMGSYIENLERFINLHLNPIDDYSSRWLVFENNFGILGSMLLMYNNDNTILEINELAVKQNFREKGIGSKLIENAYNLGLGGNCKLLELKSSLRFNVSDFYLRLGFERTGPFSENLGNDEFYHFTKKIER